MRLIRAIWSQVQSKKTSWTQIWKRDCSEKLSFMWITKNSIETIRGFCYWNVSRLYMKYYIATIPTEQNENKT